MSESEKKVEQTIIQTTMSQNLPVTPIVVAEDHSAPLYTIDGKVVTREEYEKHSAVGRQRILPPLPTAGPWTFDDGVMIQSAQGARIAELWVGDKPRVEVVANGKLLAAAYELLAACKEALRSGEFKDEQVVGRLRAVVRKVEG